MQISQALAVSGAFASSIHFCLWWVRRSSESNLGVQNTSTSVYGIPRHNKIHTNNQYIYHVCMSQCDVSSDLVAFSCHCARQLYTKNCNTITMAFTLLPQGEVLAVLGHEIGHDRMYHVHTTLLLRMWVVSPQPGQFKGNRCTVWCTEDSYGVTAMIWVVNW